MSLAPGTRLGPYEIVAPAGAGGMGEVYRARDTRLGRTVALKILPEEIATDPAARQRLTREAQTISALAHPHICTLFDVGHQDGTDYLVMEYLEGETLAERLTRGPLPVAEAVRLTIQVAEALAAAHHHGIVHRDVKPGNVMITKSGAKLLDFGIAQPPPRVSDPRATSATTTELAGAPSGRVGLFGTLPYMAPEVLARHESDARSDIFALGAVLFEMLTGRRAFDADSTAGVIAAILGNERPSLAGERAEIPAALEHLVGTCLAKDPAERWQSARDIAFYLAAASQSARTPPVPSVRRWIRPMVAGFTVGVLTVVAVGLAWWRATAHPSAQPVTHLSIPLPPESLLAPNDVPAAGSSVAVSPDGRAVAFVVTRGGQRMIELRSFESSESKTLAGTQGAMSPFFSPDGRWVAFFTESALRKVAIDDGTLVTICPTPPVTRGAAWADDGTIYLAPSFTGGLRRVPATGGAPQDFTEVRFDADESNHLLPEVLPGGETVLFTVWNGGSFEDASVWSISSRTGERQRLLDSATAPRFVPPGYVAFARESALYAVPFDPVRLAILGEAFPVVDGVWTDPATGSAHYAVGRDGTLVFATGRSSGEQRRIVWVDRAGRVTPTPVAPSPYGNVRLSPDGLRAAVEMLNDIWVYHFETGTMSRATYSGVNQFPVWTPDGRRLAISSSQRVLQPTLFWLASEGGRPADRLGHDGGVQFPGSWAPDGLRLAYAELDMGSDTGWDIRILHLDRGSASSPLVATTFNDDTPMISPDGRALAYVSDETGRPQVYVRPLSETGIRIQVSAEGGVEPVWSRDGDELFFKSGGRMLAVPVETHGQLAVGPQAVLFESDFVVTSVVPGAPSYDVAPDGRFLMVVRTGEQPLPRQLEVVLNWGEEVRRRTPPRTP